MVAIIPSSIPNGAVVLAVATGAGLAVVNVGTVNGGVVVAGYVTSLAEYDCESPLTTIFCLQS